MRQKIFYGWWVVVAGITMSFVGVGVASHSFGVVLKFLSEDLGWGRGSIATAKAFFFLAAAAMGPIVGLGLDKLDPRWVIIPSGVLMCTAFMTMSQISSIWHLYVLYALVGIGFSVLVPSFAATVLSRWFKRKRGWVIGIASCGSSLGAVVLVPFLTFLALSLGWRYGVLILGASTCILLVIIVGSFMKPSAEAMGLPYDGLAIHESSLPASEKTAHGKNPGRAVGAIHELPLLGEGMGIGKALVTPQFWLLSFAFFLAHIAMTATLVHQFSFFNDVGFSKPQAATVVSVSSAMGVLGHLVVGRLCDIFDRKLMTIISYLAMGAGILCLPIIQITGIKELSWIIFPLTFGLFHGGRLVTEPLLVAEIFGTASMGTIMGANRVIKTGGSTLGPPFAGFIFDIYGTYNFAFTILASGCVLAAIGVGVTRRPIKNLLDTKNLSKKPVVAQGFSPDNSTLKG